MCRSQHYSCKRYLYVLHATCHLRTSGQCTVSLCRCHLPTQGLPSPHRYHNAVTELKFRWHCPVCLLQSDVCLIPRQGIEVWSSQTCKGFKLIKSSSHLKCMRIQGKSHWGAVDACAATGCLLHSTAPQRLAESHTRTSLLRTMTSLLRTKQCCELTACYTPRPIMWL